MKPRAFWFHYNKPASKAAGKGLMTIHSCGACHLVEDIDCYVPIYTRHRKTQPRLVLYGKGKIEIIDNRAIIT